MEFDNNSVGCDTILRIFHAIFFVLIPFPPYTLCADLFSGNYSLRPITRMGLHTTHEEKQVGTFTQASFALVTIVTSQDIYILTTTPIIRAKNLLNRQTLADYLRPKSC